MLSLDQLRAQLRAHGLRATAPRLLVLQTLAEQASPLSHSQLVKCLAEHRLDEATVYRNLTRLTELGTEAEPRHRHAHFVCTDCDTVSCLPEDALPVPPITGHWQAAVAGATLQLQGRCPDCLAVPC
jgi:Fur family ferric uptake transcriptional regulator